MRKHIMTGLLILAAGYSAASLAGTPAPPPVTSSGNIGSAAFGIDNFLLGGMIGTNLNSGGRGPGSLAYSLHQIFYGGPDLYFDTNGVLVDNNGKPFTGTTLTGQVFKDGKKQ